MLGANPSMFAGTLLACDMGGFFLAKELAGGDVAAWLYSGLILGSMMGPTIVFSIPVALGIIEPSDRRYLALGVLAGIVTIPLAVLLVVWLLCTPVCRSMVSRWNSLSP